MFLPDINVWLALNFDSHIHHTPAKIWFDGLVGPMLFCRHSQQGFLRLASNPSVFGKHALPLQGAWAKFDFFLSDPRVSFADEPPGLEKPWRSFAQGHSFSHKIWSDAYLAAFALAGNMEVVTFDQGFSKFPGVKCVILK